MNRELLETITSCESELRNVFTWRCAINAVTTSRTYARNGILKLLALSLTLQISGVSIGLKSKEFRKSRWSKDFYKISWLHLFLLYRKPVAVFIPSWVQRITLKKHTEESVNEKNILPLNKGISTREKRRC